MTIPTIDLQLLARGANGRATALDDLRLTAATTGAFYLVGHGIEPDAGNRLFALSRRFLALPESERRTIEMANSPHFRGYTALGNEYTQGRPDWREEIDIGSELPPRAAPDGRRLGWRKSGIAWVCPRTTTGWRSSTTCRSDMRSLHIRRICLACQSQEPRRFRRFTYYETILLRASAYRCCKPHVTVPLCWLLGRFG
jgi:isopenicillin N synthase-like dioxygenase